MTFFNDSTSNIKHQKKSSFHFLIILALGSATRFRWGKLEGDAAAIFGSPIFDPFQKPHFKPRVGMRGPFDYPECLHLTYVFLFEIEHSFILQVCTSWFRFVSCSIFSLCENRLLRVSKNISKHFQKHFQKYFKNIFQRRGRKFFALNKKRGPG